MTTKYKVGVMRTVVEEETPPNFSKVVEMAVRQVEEIIAHDVDLSVQIFDFTGPHLTPVSGAYSPLDFLRLGMAEKLEREVHFLLIVTEVDLSASNLSYVLALPSRLTNIGILSIKRLNPSFWGEKEDTAVITSRLVGLMLHTLGHLFNLPHHDDQTNIMYSFETLDQLEQMVEVTDQQAATVRRHLPQEAREEVALQHKWIFSLRQIANNLPSIGRTLLRANPFSLVLNLPTMVTAALSVAIILFFTAEIWDVGSSLQLPSLTIFSVLAVIFATTVLYRSFHMSPGNSRARALAESTVVTAAATLLALFLTIILFYGIFFGLSLFSALTFFPPELKETWPTADPASALLEQIKLSMFIAATGVLTGSLGSAADSKQVIRHVLFMDEES